MEKVNSFITSLKLKIKASIEKVSSKKQPVTVTYESSPKAVKAAADKKENVDILYKITGLKKEDGYNLTMETTPGFILRITFLCVIGVICSCIVQSTTVAMIIGILDVAAIACIVSNFMQLKKVSEEDSYY